MRWVLLQKKALPFAGWYQDAACTIPMVNNRQITEDLTLYAKWQGEEKYSYTVYYVDENGDNLVSSEGNPLTKVVSGVVPNSTITEDPSDIPGYILC